MQNKGLDHQLNFEDLPSLSSLVDETFETAESKNSDEPILKDGRLNTSFLLKNARILLAAKDFELAKSIFNKLIEAGEALGASYAGLGVCFQTDGDVDASIESYREAIIYEPSFTSLIALTDLYCRKSDFKLAIKALLRANHLPKIRKSESFRIHQSLANCYLRIDQFNHAEIHFKHAFDLNSKDDNLNVCLGCFALMKENLPLATVHFQEASRANPNNSKAITGSGYVKYLGSDFDSALEYFSRALEINITNSSALFYLIKTAYKLKAFANVIELTEKFIRNNPVNSSILYALAGMYHHTKQDPQAVELCSQILGLNPEHEAAKNLRQICVTK